MAGSTVTMNGKSGPQKSSTDFTQRLKRWMAIFAETFQRNTSLSELQIKSYEIALADLTADELDWACNETLRKWTFVAMPPPGFIRDCLDPEDARRVASERWLENQPSDEELHRRGLEYCARTKEFTLTIIDMSKTYVKPEPFEVHATEARREELERQKEILRNRGFLK
jgi:hypothetical protein